MTSTSKARNAAAPASKDATSKATRLTLIITGMAKAAELTDEKDRGEGVNFFEWHGAGRDGV